MLSKVGEFAVLCPLSCITSDTFFSRKVDNRQEKQLKPCCMYNAVGVMYHKINYFCFSRHSKICFRWKTLFRITSDTPLDKLALKHSEFSKVLNGCCFLHQNMTPVIFQWPEGDFDNKMRYLASDVARYCVGCRAGQSDHEKLLKICNMPFR